MARLRDVLLPNIGDFEDVEVVELIVSVGDKVEKEGSLIVLETDKASMEVPSPYAGIVREMSVAVGSKVSEGSLICRIETEESVAEEPPKKAPKSEEKTEKPERAAPPAAPRSSLPKAEIPEEVKADERYDLVVLGAGPGGYEAAIRAGQLGLKTALIERGRIGGVCLHEGCIPSKALIDTAHHVRKVKELEERGVYVPGEIRVDLKKNQQWKQSVIDALEGFIVKACEGAGNAIIKGSGKFTGPHTIEVTLREGGTKTLAFASAIIATGSRAVEIPTLRFDGKTVLSARDALVLEKLPAKLIVVGGGYIGLELGIAFKKLGSDVTVVELQKQLLPGTDAALVRPLARRLGELGIEVLLEAKVASFESRVAEIETKKGMRDIKADCVLVAVGRRPNTEDIGLNAAGVKTDEKGFIATNERKQTNVPHLYAVGDLTHGPALAHKASAEGVVAAEAIAGLPAAFDRKAIPAVVFTDPELSYVGLGEEDAKRAGFSPKSITVPNRGLGRALAAGEPEGTVKLVYDETSGTLLGAFLAGGPATDMIGSLGLAVEMGADIEDIALTIYPHPTFSEQVMIAAQRVVHQEKKK